MPQGRPQARLPWPCLPRSKCKEARGASFRRSPASRTQQPAHKTGARAAATRCSTPTRSTNNKCYSKCTSNLNITLWARVLVPDRTTAEGQFPRTNTVAATSSSWRARRSYTLHPPVRRASKPYEARWPSKEPRQRVSMVAAGRRPREIATTATTEDDRWVTKEIDGPRCSIL